MERGRNVVLSGHSKVSDDSQVCGVFLAVSGLHWWEQQLTSRPGQSKVSVKLAYERRFLSYL